MKKEFRQAVCMELHIARGLIEMGTGWDSRVAISTTNQAYPLPGYLSVHQIWRGLLAPLIVILWKEILQLFLL